MASIHIFSSMDKTNAMGYAYVYVFFFMERFISMQWRESAWYVASLVL